MITTSYAASASTVRGNLAGTSWPYSCSTSIPCSAAAAMNASAPVSDVVLLKRSKPVWWVSWATQLAAGSSARGIGLFSSCRWVWSVGRGVGRPALEQGARVGDQQPVDLLAGQPVAQQPGDEVLQDVAVAGPAVVAQQRLEEHVVADQ